MRFETPNLSMGETWIIEGRPFGEIFTYGFKRNENGKIIVGSNGIPLIDHGKADVYLGNFNYDWRSGLTNSLSYKNWHMSFLIDLNYGGVRQSATEAMMLSAGTSKASLVGRAEGIVVDGVKEDGSVNDINISAEDYYKSVGGRINSGTGELFNHDATNSRLREFSLGYNFPIRNSVIKSLRVSAVGRNLFYIYNGCNWFDPDVSYDVSTNGQGAESAFLPGTRTLGFNVKIILIMINLKLKDMKNIFQIKKHLYVIMSGIILGTALLYSCTDDFAEYNTDKTEVMQIGPEQLPSLFSKAQYEGNNWLTTDNYVRMSGAAAMHLCGFMAIPSSWGGHNELRKGWCDAGFEKLYSAGLPPLFSILNMTQGEDGYEAEYGVALIWKVFLMHQLTDIWGPIPYTKACSGEKTIPYESQKDVVLPDV